MPGTLKAATDAPQPVIRVIAFNKERLVEEPVESVDGLAAYLGESMVTWINVDGLGDTSTIRQIGELLGLHSLALEDVINVHQRAKVEPYHDHLFVVTRLVTLAPPEHLESEQISLFLGKNYVLTFQQRVGDCFDPVRERIRTSRGRIREAGADYLAYALIDAVIDSYFPVLDQFADHLEDLEDEVAVRQSPEVIERIHGLRNDLLLLRRSVRPHQDTMNELVRDEHPLISAETRFFFRDCYDHTVQLIDLLEVYREMCADLRDFYLSIVSNRMNEIMKVLTIIATIFIPLGFVAGVYGMNFNTQLAGNMPELNLPYGYLGALAVMMCVALGMLIYFWRSGWIGPSPPRKRG
jgi:magnesium transporter